MAVKHLLWFLVALICVCCVPTPRVPKNLPADSGAVTVALMVERPSGWGITCSGVWVADEWILTAKHCTVDSNYEELGIPPVLREDMKYITDPENHYLWDAQVVYRDPTHDLALLRAKTRPIHQFAKLAGSTPAVGTHVHATGHPLGLPWTYLTGQIAALRTDLPGLEDKGPFVQIQIPITHGSSGCGVFTDDTEELVGIGDMASEALPAEGFFLSVEAINPFLKASHL